MSWETKLAQMVAKTTRTAFNYYCMVPTGRLRLFYTEAHEGQWGDLYARTYEPKPPDNYKLATSESIPRNLTESQMRSWINDIARRLPIIGD